jgi:uncharacterized membrane protein YbhN (UPF0104 family)
VIAVGPARLAAILSRADPVPLALMLPCVVALYCVRALAWRVALRRLGMDMGRWRAVRIVFAGEALIFLPGGDLWRTAVVSKAEGLHDHRGAIAASIVFDDIVFMGLFSLALVPALARARYLAPVVALVLGGELATWGLLLWSRGYTFMVRVASALPPLHRIADDLAELGPTFRRLASAGTLLRVGGLDALAAIMTFALFGLALAAVRTTGVRMDESAFVLAVAQILGGLTMVPAGLGAYEALLTGLLATVGVAPAAGAAAALLYRGFSDVLVGGLGLLASLGLRPPSEEAMGSKRQGRSDLPSAAARRRVRDRR